MLSKEKFSVRNEPEAREDRAITASDSEQGTTADNAGVAFPETDVVEGGRRAWPAQGVVLVEVRLPGTLASSAWARANGSASQWAVHMNALTCIAMMDAYYNKERFTRPELLWQGSIHPKGWASVTILRS
jgi:hypothetical protein